MKSTNNQSADQYCDDVAEMMHQVMYGVDAWQWQTPRTNMSDIMKTRSNDNTPTPEPVQLELFPDTPLTR
ncbi:hypothetical protein [Candidatus Puniceispirillum marinum]|uniref:hypothetical protein n=1 Tax=Candidatus Puniceispirillum marinum TaxID=767892 RepID=UPI0005A46229|nr:hypothetical protein [Candidatus Puniceispirillum marinum]